MDPSLSFHKHCSYVSDRIDNRNNLLKAIVWSSWGQVRQGSISSELLMCGGSVCIILLLLILETIYVCIWCMFF